MQNIRTRWAVFALFALLLLGMTPLTQVSGAPLNPHNRWGDVTVDAGSGPVAPGGGFSIYAYVDGVVYGTGQTYASGKFDVDCNGDDLTFATWVKEGGENGNMIYYLINHSSGRMYANQVSSYSWGSFENANMDFVLASQTIEPKINEVCINPGDSGAQYVYLYNPSATSSVVLDGNYYLTKNDGSLTNPAEDIPLTGTINAQSTLYFDLGNASGVPYLDNADELKLVWGNTGSVAAGNDIVLDRVEWGFQMTTPDNTSMADAPQSTTPGNSLKRISDGYDTDDCSVDFADGVASGRGTVLNDVPKSVLSLGMTVDASNNPVLNWTLQSEPSNRTRADIRIFRSADRDTWSFAGDLVYTAGAGDTTWTDTTVSSGTYYYYVRPYNVIGLSALSTMGVYHTFSFTYNAGIGNDNWISMPHTSDYVMASDIVLDIEGALSPGGVDVYINYIGKWDPATQGVTEAYFYQEVGPPALWGWNGGADFAINPGDSITIQLSGNTGSFDWQVAGTDVRCTKSFTYNAGIGNDNWITVPWTGQYTMASDIVLDIEGALSPGGVDVYINYIGKWDPATQGVTEAYFYQEVGPPALWGWNGGADFAIAPGDGITIQLSGNTANFNWQQALTSNPIPDAVYP